MSPVHPATVHFPITFAFLTGALDALYLASTSPATSEAVASAFKSLDIQVNTALFPTLSHYTNIFTIITAVPAIISGAVQLAPLIQRDGFGSKKVQTGVLHAAISDLTVFAAIYNWWIRREAAGFVPTTSNATLSAAVVPVTFFAAFLGGQLVYTFGMGIGRGASNAKKSQ